ncbi:peptidoglycan-binding domain-containing protein [Deinococcus aerolatus]
MRISADGSFGLGTETALQSFQAASGVAANSFAGPATSSALAVGT